MDVNVYDFDNTIYDGETLVDIIMYYVKTDPKIRKYIPKLIVIALKDHFHLFTVPEAIKAYASFLEGYYVKIKNIDETVVKFWNKNEHKIKPWYASVQKDSDIIVSGTLEIILNEIAKRIGIKHYIGSVIDGKTGKFTQLCFMDNKAKLFKEKYPDAHIVNFYTDSLNDKSMMDLADHVFIVKGDKITKQR